MDDPFRNDQVIHQEIIKYSTFIYSSLAVSGDDKSAFFFYKKRNKGVLQFLKHQKEMKNG